MKLYDGGRAPNPRRVQIFLKEKGIEIEKVQLDINALEPKSVEFTAKNPMQTVPALELDDGTVISETVAICRYFEEMQPEPRLFGKTSLEKTLIEMWQRRTEFYFLLPVGTAFRHLHPAAKNIEPEQVAEWGEMNKGRAVKFMHIIEKELGEREYVAGEDFSIADITLLAACQFMKPARIAFGEEFVNLHRWYDQVSARPSAAFD